MNIDSSYINAYNVDNITPSTIGKIDSLEGNEEISKVKKETTQPIEADTFELQKSSLSHLVENINNGVAMASIAKNGILEQIDILNKVEVEIAKATDEKSTAQQQQESAQNVVDGIEKYDQIAQNTSYNNKALLRTQGDASDDISIVADDSIINLSKADTTSISDSLKSFMADVSSDPNAVENLLNITKQGQEQLNLYAKDYSDASEIFQNKAKEYIKRETETSNIPSSVKNIDYGKESADFNKTNLMSQMGYLMQTQANAAQAKNVALLS